MLPKIGGLSPLMCPCEVQEEIQEGSNIKSKAEWK